MAEPANVAQLNAKFTTTGLSQLNSRQNFQNGILKMTFCCSNCYNKAEDREKEIDMRGIDRNAKCVEQLYWYCS